MHFQTPEQWDQVVAVPGFGLVVPAVGIVASDFVVARGVWIDRIDLPVDSAVSQPQTIRRPALLKD